MDLDQNKVSTFCGTGESGHVDGSCQKAKLNFPQKLSLDISSSRRILYVTELNDCVRAIDLVNRDIFTFCGGFKSKNGLKDGHASDALMNFPYGMVKMDSISFGITESDNHSLRVMTLKDSEKKDSLSPAKSEKTSESPDKNLKDSTHPAQQPKFNQSTYNMLLTVSQSSSSSVTETVLELI